MAQSNSAFTRAASLAQLVLALGPSPRPCRHFQFSFFSLAIFFYPFISSPPRLLPFLFWSLYEVFKARCSTIKHYNIPTTVLFSFFPLCRSCCLSSVSHLNFFSFLSSQTALSCLSMSFLSPSLSLPFFASFNDDTENWMQQTTTSISHVDNTLLSATVNCYSPIILFSVTSCPCSVVSFRE